ncbi:hypothetical protein [Cupriavidus consociatus]|uniref:hypothetical protein n=1 Tax=Cupriavidus consociatus TaxID=2821357 RepID=UPI001AE21EFE|nr:MULTISPECIES: hypothetical protein [unclassified Cupriavidus]MBP0621592.1 hypothetical protein [Cupriavidus sp. LEh25]MDK2658265.1 hypothetical protein [Cupriavidus sp. LEh21]
MNKLAVLASVVSIAVLLTACGGGGDDNNGGSSTPQSNAGANGGASAPTPAPAPAAFSCPDGYRKLTLSNSSVPNASMSIVTDDNIAKLTVKTPASGLTNVTLCLGKPNPVPAGVSADYVYELKTDGAYASLINPQLMLTFTTASTLSVAPTIETAQSTASGGTYAAAPGSSGAVNGTNVTVTASALAAGIYVVRLPH